MTAPVDGRVAQLSVHTIGGVVETAKPIMVIVPVGGALELEVRVLNKDVGFVQVGQPVSVKVDAFPFTRYGTVAGRVDRIASDAVEDEKLGLVYVVRIGLKAPRSAYKASEIALNPGLSATADIQTGRRSLLSMLASPVSAVGHSAGRER